MKLWRIAALAALVSAMTVLSASADLFIARFTDIPGTAVPTDGPTTTLVRGNIEDQTMIVHFTCGQPSTCIVTGDQFHYGAGNAIMVAPEGANTPAPLFVFGFNPVCASEYGVTAKTGVWMRTNGEVVSHQCFRVVTESRYTVRPNRPPITRIERLELPSNIAEITATARARAQARARARP